MVQGRNDLRFTLEPGESIGILGEQVWENFQSRVAANFRVPGTIHLPPAAGAPGL
jgi:hypothetical protein